MACLLPQFTCKPETRFFVKSTHQNRRHLIPSRCFMIVLPAAKSKRYACFRTQCILSSTAVIDIEKLQAPSIEPLSTSLTYLKPLAYIGAIDPLLKEKDVAEFAAESLLENEDLAIEAAAGEAVALARAAAEMARDAVQLVGSRSMEQGQSENAPSENILHLDMARLFAKETDKEIMCSTITDVPSEDLSVGDRSVNAGLGITGNGGNFLEVQESEGIIRSKRQPERRARRTHAADRVRETLVSIKTKTKSSSKQRAGSQKYRGPDALLHLRPLIENSKLLTAAEEVSLSLGIQDLLKLNELEEELIKQYGSRPTFEQWAAAAGVDERTLRMRIIHGTECKVTMLECNIKLVISIASKFSRRKDLSNLVQEGIGGLMTAMEKFDPKRGFRFSTYAHWWIKQAVQKYVYEVQDEYGIDTLTPSMVKAKYKIYRARKKLTLRNGKEPTDEEVAAEAGVSMQTFIQATLRPPIRRSLDDKIGDSNVELQEVLSHPDEETMEDMFNREQIDEDVVRGLEALKPKECEVMKMRYGIGDGIPKTLQEIGEKLSLSRERVRQIEAQAMRRLKGKGELEHLKEYLHLLITD